MEVGSPACLLFNPFMPEYYSNFSLYKHKHDVPKALLCLEGLFMLQNLTLNSSLSCVFSGSSSSRVWRMFLPPPPGSQITGGLTPAFQDLGQVEAPLQLQFSTVQIEVLGPSFFSPHPVRVPTF